MIVFKYGNLEKSYMKIVVDVMLLIMAVGIGD